MRFRSVLYLTLVALVVACSSAPPAKHDEKKGETTPGRRGYSSFGGDSPVGVIPDAVLHDAQRNKDLHMSIDYPTKPGPFPVVIFSHGLGGSQRGYVGLSAQWASYGFIVIKPSHADARTVTSTPVTSTPVTSAPAANAPATNATSTSAAVTSVKDAVEEWEKQTPDDVRNRVRDITFILDSFADLETKYPELEKKIDREKIGVGGHSYGALTALLVGGMQTFANGQATSFADPRVKAVLAMSPQGTSEARGITRDSWSAIKVPVMFMTGTLDKGAKESETPEWRHEAFEFSPAGDKWFLSLIDARHMTFAGRFGPAPEELPRDRNAPVAPQDPRYPRDPRDPRDPQATQPQQPRSRASGSALSTFDRDRNIFNIIKGVSTAYWDAYLRNEQAAKDYLAKLGQRTDMVVEKK